MQALESTISTLRRTHFFLFLAAISVLLLAFPAGPDHDRALSELAALRTFVSDDEYGAYCAELFLAKQEEDWRAARRLSEARPDGIPVPDSVPFGGTVFCERPGATDDLESYAHFLTSEQRIEFPSAQVDELYEAVQRLLSSEWATGSFTFAQFVLPDAEVESLVMVDLPHGHAPVAFIARPSPDYREALSTGRDSLLLAATFRKGNLSGGPDTGVRGAVGARSSSRSPLDWASEQGAYGHLVENDRGTLKVLPGLEPFWDAVRSSTLPEAVRYIQSLSGRDGITIEALGIDIGIVTLGLVGPLVLLAFVIYMALHTRHLVRLRGHNQEPVRLPWVALFQDDLSIASTWATILILPAAAAIAIGIRAARDAPLVALWALAATGFLAFLGMSILRETARLRSDPEPDGAAVLSADTAPAAGP